MAGAIDKLVPLPDVDRIQPDRPDMPVGGERRLLDDPQLRAEEEVSIAAELPDRDDCSDLRIR
jgi:hypothetical protein